MALPEYELYAIRYAMRDAQRRDHFIGGEFPEIRAECHCYHGNTTRKRQEEHQRCNEGLHG